ncbi:MAG TPA: hypothetical protein ENK18_17815, partial [Deltaproteobacteria bacterium]|nr:hypothetical protein [Deltaproteobacteria bacterium]
MRSLLLALTLTACSGGVDKPGTTGDSGDPTGTPAPSEGWCAVQGVFNANCMQCHSAASALGGLDLETSPYTALVGVTSQAFGRVLVQPGDPADSLLYLKMSGSRAPRRVIQCRRRGCSTPPRWRSCPNGSQTARATSAIRRPLRPPRPRGSTQTAGRSPRRTAWRPNCRPTRTVVIVMVLISRVGPRGSRVDPAMRPGGRPTAPIVMVGSTTRPVPPPRTSTTTPIRTPSRSRHT